MLQLITTLATRLHRIRVVLWAFGIAAAVVFLRGVFVENGTSTSSLAGLVGVVWAGFVIALAQLFAHRRFDRPAAGARFIDRLRWRLVLAAAWCAMGLMGGLAVLLVLFSFKAFRAS